MQFCPHVSEAHLLFLSEADMEAEVLDFWFTTPSHCCLPRAAPSALQAWGGKNNRGLKRPVRLL